jgi:hypothetical protein
MSEFKMPTEVVELPSKGLIYPEDNPLSSGKVEMKYMTAKEEDILTNQSYIQNGTVLDKVLESLIVSKINFSDLIIGDKNALMIAARILGYGKDYEFTYDGEPYTVDLSTLENTDFDTDSIERGKNEFKFTLPNSGVELTYKILTHADERKISKELEGLRKLNKDAAPELSTRLKHIILSVNGDSENRSVRQFVDNAFLAIDSRAFRKHISKNQPDVDLKFTTNGGQEVTLPIGINFFWPDA